MSQTNLPISADQFILKTVIPLEIKLKIALLVLSCVLFLPDFYETYIIGL